MTAAPQSASEPAALRFLCWTHASNRTRARAAGAVAAVSAALKAYKEGIVAEMAKAALEKIKARR